jgi:hypothetical protein
MAESQHSLLSEAELETTRPQRTWNPLGRASPELEYAFLPAYREERQSFSEDVLREVGLGITNTSGETLPRGKRDSVSSEASPATTPGFLKTPQGTPATPHQHNGNCPSRRTVLQRRFSWVPVTIFVLAFYATCFSGAYLAIAIRKPRWPNIGTGESLAASTANLLCAFFAKTIELAYVTICVAFLGQVLSRRALAQDSRGVSISDMSMRAWIMQPGSMLVHWETLRYSALTFLGLIALIATFVAMLYTTAAEALGELPLSLVEDVRALTRQQYPQSFPWGLQNQPSSGAKCTLAGVTPISSLKIVKLQSPTPWIPGTAMRPAFRWSTSVKPTTILSSG